MLLSNGTVYCWGANQQSELGDGGVVQRTAPSTPVNIAALGAVKIVELASAQLAKCGRTDDGSIWCWGENKNGILGINDGNVIVRATPVKANVLSTAAQLDMSHKVACVVDTASQLFCWGTNRRGQASAKAPTTTEDSVVLEPTQIQF
jgi:alpha-tubulin suppressor-like RCC1 family protein